MLRTLKILGVLLFYIVLPGKFAQAQIISEEDFESYENDALITSASSQFILFDVFYKDAPVTDSVAYSGTKSLQIRNHVDVVYLLPKNYDTGAFEISFKMYVKEKHYAYMNIQKSLTPNGSNAMFVLYFDSLGGLRVDAGKFYAATPTYTPNTWLDIKIVVDFNRDYAEFFLDSAKVVGWQFSKGANGTGKQAVMGGINFYGHRIRWTNFFIDDIKFKYLYLPVNVRERESFNFGMYPNPSQGNFTISNPISESYELKITDLAGKIILQQKVDLAYSRNNQLNLPKGMYLVNISKSNQTITKKLIIY